MNRVLKWIAIVLAGCGALLNIPALVRGLSFLGKWIRVQSTDGPYFSWAYFVTGLICVALCGLGFELAIRAMWSKRFRIAASLSSLFLGLGCMFVLPNVGPELDMAEANQRILGHSDHSLSDWDEAHGKFPTNEDELRKALAVRPLQEPAIYFREGKPIPLAVRFAPNSTGPSTESLPLDPGTIVYAVSSDYKEYWLTMSSLQNPVKGPVVWEHVGGHFEQEPIWVMHRKHHNPGEGFQPFME